MAIHVIKGNGEPTTIPPEVGCHYIDQTNEAVYQAVGTDLVSDWILLGGSASAYTTFKSLQDTPASYTGEAGKVPAVNGTEDGLIYVEQAAGVTTFTGLTDTPAVYTGKGKSIVSVNSAEDGLNFDPVEEVQFKIASTDLSHSEGKLVYNPAKKCFNAYNDKSEVALQVGRESWRRSINNTGVDILNGSIVCTKSWDGTAELPELCLADNRTLDDSVRAIGMLTETLSDGEQGEVTTFGEVGGFDTSTYGESDIVFLGEDGGVTTTSPKVPYYPIRIGTVGKIHATEGTILVDIVPFNNTDTDVNAQGFFNGIALQRHRMQFVVSAGTVYVDVDNEADPTIDLPIMLDGIRYDLNTLTGAGAGGAARAALTAGVPNVPQISFIYVELDPSPTPVLKSSTTYPYGNNVLLGTVSVFDAATTDADGPFSFQRWNNCVDNGVGNGMANYVTQKLRLLGALYQSGVDPTITINTVPNPDSVTVSTTSGVISQLHIQTFDAQDGTEYYVINDPVVGIKKIANLNEITAYADGTPISNNDRFGLNILGAQSSEFGVDRLLVSLPSGSYSTDDSAINDIYNYANTSVPDGANLKSTTVRLFRLVFDYSSGGGGEYTNLLGANGYQDERGFPLNSATGGGGGGTGSDLTNFSDAVFTWYSTADATKVVTVDLSGMTTATSIALAMQPTGGTIGYDEDILANTSAIAGKEPTITAGTTADYWRGDKSFQPLNKTAVGLDQVDNTSDADKPISDATQTALNLKAPIASPTFTGTVTAPDTDITGHLKVTGQQYSVPASTLTPLGTTQTIDFSTSNVQTIDLESATGNVTVTLTNGAAGASYVVKVIQDSTTPLDIVWPASVKWSEGTEPVISVGADAIDIINFIYDGTSFYGAFVQNFS